MARLRIIYGNRVPTDHLIDVENLPESFTKSLEVQYKANWIHPDKKEFMLEYKSNPWEDLQTIIKKHNKDFRVPDPICVVQTDDAERARILPQNIKDSDIPKIVLDIAQEDVKAPAEVKKSYICPNCDFEGKGQDDIEGHLKEKHGMNPAEMSLAGKETSPEKKPDVVQMMYACVSCDFQSPVKAELVTHSITHLQAKHEPVASPLLCGVDGCDFKAPDAMKLRGHRMGAHRKKTVAA